MIRQVRRLETGRLLSSLTLLKGNLQLLYFTVEITWLRALLRTAAGYQFRQRSAALISNVIDWLRNLQVNCLSGFWWMSMAVALSYRVIWPLTSRILGSRISFAVAGGFIIGMFLSAADEEDVDYWTRQINTYRNLLKAHSVNFNFAKLASIRIDLILQRDTSDSVEGGMALIPKPQSTETQNVAESHIQGSPSVAWPETEEILAPLRQNRCRMTSRLIPWSLSEIHTGLNGNLMLILTGFLLIKLNRLGH